MNTKTFKTENGIITITYPDTPLHTVRGFTITDREIKLKRIVEERAKDYINSDFGLGYRQDASDMSDLLLPLLLTEAIEGDE